MLTKSALYKTASISLIIAMFGWLSVMPMSAAPSGAVSVEGKGAYLLLRSGYTVHQGAMFNQNAYLQVTDHWSTDLWHSSNPEIDLGAKYANTYGGYRYSFAGTWFGMPKIDRVKGDIFDFTARFGRDYHPGELESSLGWTVTAEHQVFVGGKPVTLLAVSAPVNVVLGGGWSIPLEVEFAKHGESRTANVNGSVGLSYDFASGWNATLKAEGYRNYAGNVGQNGTWSISLTKTF